MTAVSLDRKQIIDLAVDIAIRLILIGMILLWCFRIFEPFIIPVVWGVILSVALGPLFTRLTVVVGGRRGLTAVLFTLLALALVIAPTYRVTESAIRSVVEFDRRVEDGTVRIPVPDERVRDWPLVGDRIYGVWAAAHDNLQGALTVYEPQVRTARTWAVGKARGLGSALMHTMLALVMAGFMLTYAEHGAGRARAVAARVGGARAERLVSVSAATIRSVAQGVLGVALLQTAAAGLGMLVAGIPGWGIWTVFVLVLAVVQLPPLLVLGPVAVWYFGSGVGTIPAVLFAVWSLIVSVSDGFLKPLFLGRGVAVPMPVILVGAIGGVMLYGIIGLFVGAVVLAVGYELFTAWMESQAAAGDAASGA